MHGIGQEQRGQWVGQRVTGWQSPGPSGPMGSGRAGEKGPGVTGTNVIASTAAAMAIRRLQRQDLEGSKWGRARLGGNHAPEASHRPCPHMVVISTN